MQFDFVTEHEINVKKLSNVVNDDNFLGPSP